MCENKYVKLMRGIRILVIEVGLKSNLKISYPLSYPGYFELSSAPGVQL